ncbi:transketolase [Acidobacteria bacterium AH-259-D05]|nr:transketolase [Acidobacteria bacterium AH-259-D05]
MANRLRKHSLTSTTQAGSGHPSSCFSCAELISTLFFHVLRFEVASPENPRNDRFVLSKGHAAPVLWAAWAEAGAFPVEQLQTLRKIDSELEGHPTPRNPWVDVATGSLGQGLSVGIGMALAARMNQTGNRIYVLLGDGEAAEGSVWEAAALASHYHLDNLIAILDINRLGQSQPTMYEHDLESHRERFASNGWHTQIIDGHNIEEAITSLQTAVAVQDRPAAIMAHTLKGKGVSLMENRDGWHGKPVPAGEELEKALQEIGDDLDLEQELHVASPDGNGVVSAPSKGHADSPLAPEAPHYSVDEQVATRQAYGAALRKLGKVNPDIVVLDGDTKNSTHSQEFLKAYPERFVECFIAEQNMVGAAVGLSAMGKIPFASTFACFLTRAYDQIRMAAISHANIKLCGSHAGISIGQDGPSQMGLEDLAMMRAVAGSTVLYPSDAVSTEGLMALAAQTRGIVYIRTSRPKTPVLYSNDEKFPIGGSKILKSSPEDRATIVAAGVTLHEALTAYQELQSQNLLIRVIDLYSVKPLDEETLRKAARETQVLITVEDHYPEGGLGDAVLSAVANESCKFHKLAVTGLPRSGEPGQLMDAFGISARVIVETVRKLTS